jgi:hypothetical protein
LAGGVWGQGERDQAHQDGKCPRQNEHINDRPIFRAEGTAQKTQNPTGKNPPDRAPDTDGTELSLRVSQVVEGDGVGQRQSRGVAKGKEKHKDDHRLQRPLKSEDEKQNATDQVKQP